MNVNEVVDMKTFKEFVKIKGKNAPYCFFSKNKHILDNIKNQYGYKPTASINEILFYEDNKDKEFNCLNCNIKLYYNTDKNLMPKYCSSACCSLHNKDIITEKRKATMAKLFQDDEWMVEYKSKISKKSSEFNKSDEGKIANKRKSEEIKCRILSGEFTPNITNSWTRMTAKYKDKKFRSMFEALFFAYHTQIKSNIQYEKLRIKYEFENKISTYITDFIDETDKIVYEIKPNSLLDDAKNIAKFSALTRWAIENEYAVRYITEDTLNEYLINLLDIEFKELFYKKYPKWKR